MCDVGNLVIVKTEFTDQSGWKLRPGLVVGEYLDDYLLDITINMSILI